MAKDPLGLFPETEKQAAQPTPTTQSSGPGFLATLLIVVAVFAGAYVWQKGGIDFGGGGSDGQKHEQVDVNKIPAKGSFVFVLEETADRKNYPHVAKLNADLDLWSGLEARGVSLNHFYDIDSKNVASFKADAEKAGLPALMVVSPAGKVVLAVRCPETREGVIEAVNKVVQ